MDMVKFEQVLNGVKNHQLNINGTIKTIDDWLKAIKKESASLQNQTDFERIIKTLNDVFTNCEAVSTTLLLDVGSRSKSEKNRFVRAILAYFYQRLCWVLKDNRHHKNDFSRLDARIVFGDQLCGGYFSMKNLNDLDGNKLIRNVDDAFVLFHRSDDDGFHELWHKYAEYM